MKKFLLFSFLITITLFSNGQTIYEIQGQQAASPYKGQTVTTSGIVTAAFSQGYFIQDGAGEWSGIYVYDQTNKPLVGDSITITATVDEYYDFTELKTITSFTVNSSENTLPSPILLETGNFTEAYESVLVVVEDAVCLSEINGYGEWYVDDGSGKVVIDDMGYRHVPTLGYIYSIKGPVSFSYSEYKIEPRDINDIDEFEIFSIKEGPTQSNITNSGFTISWTTNYTGSTIIEYGLTSELELGKLTGDDDVLNHTITLSGLDAATPYYIKAYSVKDNDTTLTSTKVYSTVSNSTGEIKVYFNHSVDASVATGQVATVCQNSIEDTVISYIGKAQHTLDITMYDVESEAIIEAINQANTRGVDVRYITDVDMENEVLDNLNTSINIMRGNSNAIMHDKFIIIDVESVDSSWVITGSLNHTIANLGWDYNNMICIQDQALANAYLLEFNEMFGSTGLTPDSEKAKFGNEKTDNTPHNFIINNIPVQLYFSPSDHTGDAIVNAIGTANNEMEFGMMVFTENNLGQSVKDAKNRAVDIRGIIDYVEYSGSEFQGLLDANVDVLDYANADGSQWPDGPTFHSKYATIDFNSTDSDPIVVTGSHNWSASADSKNDENTLIIHDSIIANLYHQEFSQRYNDLMTPVAINDTAEVIMNDSIIVDFSANDYVHAQVTSTTVTIGDAIHGSLELLEDNTLKYIPETDFTGNDSIMYKVVNDDFTNLYDSAFIFIKVYSEDDYYVTANDDTVSINKSTLSIPTKVTYNVLKNDENPYNLDVAFKIVKQAAHGTVIFSVIDSTITYTPDVDYVGKDTVSYCFYSTQDTTIADTANFILTMKDYVSINEINNNRIYIYPNPVVNNSFTIENSKNIKSVEIFNSIGQLVYKNSDINRNSVYVDFAGHNKGVYITKVILEDDSLSTNKLFVK
ncbi:MAG: hypothetical protein DRJ01_07105 [Bacteroidetes bacterium]|nr:MAG: hypothetical protein DRJ01_07105 [Bacteroidota bacterium]